MQSTVTPIGDKTRRASARRRPVDGTLLLIVTLLLLAGLLTLFSATYYQAQDQGDALREVKQQLIGIAVGVAMMQVTMRVPYRFFRRPMIVWIGLGASLLLLVLVLIPGVGRSLNGSRRWLSLFGLSFQPSELAKPMIVLYMAAALDAKPERAQKLIKGILPLLFIPAVFFLVILQQPNLSTAGSVLIVSALMVLLAGARWKHLSILGVCGMAVGFAYAWSEPYRRERLLSFRDPFAQMSDEGYQLAQSLIAIGSGGLFGNGLGQGRQKFSYLPYPESDFIFAIVGEDFGLLGCLVVVLLFVAFLFVGLRIAATCRDRFGCLLAAGLTVMIAVQAFLNIGVVVGVLPTTGLPLPFFSAGGTSMMILLSAVGVLLNISRGEQRKPC